MSKKLQVFFSEAGKPEHVAVSETVPPDHFPRFACGMNRPDWWVPGPRHEVWAASVATKIECALCRAYARSLLPGAKKSAKKKK